MYSDFIDTLASHPIQVETGYTGSEPKRKPWKRVPSIELKLKPGAEDKGRCAGIYVEFKDEFNGKKVYFNAELHRVILYYTEEG